MVRNRSSTLSFFRPENFGFTAYGAGWMKPLPGLGQVAFAPIAWQHSQLVSGPVTNGVDQPSTNALELIHQMQGAIWGMQPRDCVPTHLLAVVQETGGALLAAYDPRVGLTREGWYGFVLGFGSRDGVLISHMLGVRKELRGAANLGWTLKILQAHAALETGHHAAKWTFDPMRGVNANLSIEKLGGVVTEFTIDKYGAIKSLLYGDLPTDRFTLQWDLTCEDVQNRLREVQEGAYRAPGLDGIHAIPTVGASNLESIRRMKPPHIAYEIPGDIDRLMAKDEGQAIDWRREMRQVLPELITTKTAQTPIEAEQLADPALYKSESREGDYSITGFASGEVAGRRKTYYLLKRKD